MGILVDFLAFDDDFPVIFQFKEVQASEQRALSRSTCSDQADHITFLTLISISFRTCKSPKDLFNFSTLIISSLMLVPPTLLITDRHPLFDDIDNRREDQYEYEVVDRYDEQVCHVIKVIRSKCRRHTEQFKHADERRKRGILQCDDELISKRRQCASECLWQDDPSLRGQLTSCERPASICPLSID